MQIFFVAFLFWIDSEKHETNITVELRKVNIHHTYMPFTEHKNVN